MKESIMTKVSVVTIVKDHASGLIRTLNSLLAQTNTDWESIIVVGASADGTMPAAMEFQLKDSRVRIIEQTGSGIYDAMNEGLEEAIGSFIWFMNAGDSFASTSVMAHAVQEFSNSEIAVVVGGYQIGCHGDCQAFIYREGNIKPWNFAFTRRGGCHQAMIFRTQTLKNIGGFNIIYPLASDFELVLKVLKNSEGKRVSEIYAIVEPGGRADQRIFDVHAQKHQIRNEMLGGSIIFYASILWTALARAKIQWRQVCNSIFSKRR